MTDAQQLDVATGSSSETELMVAQDDKELQALKSAQVSFDNLEGLKNVLKDLLEVYSSRTSGYLCRALNVILETMKRHLNNQEIQMNGSACLLCIAKQNDDLSFEFKRRITKALLDGMTTHKTDMAILKCGLNVINCFNIPRDVLSEYERLLGVVLDIVSQEQQQDEMLMLGLRILRPLAGIHDAEHKKLAVDKGTIKIILQIIAAKILKGTADEILEQAWIVLSNLTDLTPENCKKFLDEKGFDHFFGCLQRFSKEPKFDPTGMTVVLARTSKVKDLRSAFMKDEYLQAFSNMLTTYSSNFVTSFNVVDILSNIASDGPELFTGNGIQLDLRNELLNLIAAVIGGWKVESNSNNMAFSSLKPFLALLIVDHTPQVQYFGVWAVTNIAFHRPDKYWPMLEDEGGLELLQKFTNANTSYKEISELADTAVGNYKRYKEKTNDQQVVEMNTED